MITKDELIVGKTYTDVSETARKVIFIGEQKVMFINAKGDEQAEDIEVMLLVLSLSKTI